MGIANCMQTRDPATKKTAANYSETQVWADYEQTSVMFNKTNLFNCPLYARNVNDAPSLWHNVLRQINEHIMSHNCFSSVVYKETSCFHDFRKLEVGTGNPAPN